MGQYQVWFTFGHPQCSLHTPVLTIKHEKNKRLRNAGKPSDRWERRGRKGTGERGQLAPRPKGRVLVCAELRVCVSVCLQIQGCFYTSAASFLRSKRNASPAPRPELCCREPCHLGNIVEGIERTGCVYGSRSGSILVVGSDLLSIAGPRPGCSSLNHRSQPWFQMRWGEVLLVCTTGGPFFAVQGIARWYGWRSWRGASKRNWRCGLKRR